MAPAVEKVTAFLLRDHAGRRELLVFRHPLAGVQLPAGTAEPGENPESAGYREVREETGLTDIAVIATMGVVDEPMEPGERMLAGPAPLREAPDESASCLDVPIGANMTVRELGRGIRVRLLRIEPPFALVRYTLYDFQAGELVPLTITEGWLPEDSLAIEVKRHLLLMRTTAETRDRWICKGDAEQDFALFWVPLTPTPDLVRGHDAMLNRVLPILKTATL